ncbi:MAG: hypothetical protein R3C68_06370 [Myxococcota bacterium]
MPLRDITVRDVLDGNLTAINATSSGGVFGGGSITWTSASYPGLGHVNPDERVVLSFEADIVSPWLMAWLSATKPARSDDLNNDVLSDGDSGNAGAQPTLVTVSRAVPVGETVSLEGDDDPAFNPGDVVRYTSPIRTSALRTLLMLSWWIPWMGCCNSSMREVLKSMARP